MAAPDTINVAELIDNRKLGRFQISTFVLCGMCLIMDGFDVQAMGFVAPTIIREWNIPNAQMAPVLSAALFGVLIGSLFLSMIADRVGRRPVLIGAALFFSVLTLLTARVNTIGELLLIRFIAGVGLGSIMPNAMALVSEYSSRATRVTAMMIVSNGFTLGAAVAGGVSALLIPRFGWRSVFYFGGTIPLIIAIVMLIRLPESLQFLVLRAKRPRDVKKWLTRVDPEIVVTEQTRYVVHEEAKKGVPLIHLFHEGRALGTVMLWIINFMNLLNLYFLSSWLPTVVRDAGYSNTTAVLAGTTVQLGGGLGSLGLGWFVHRFGFIRVLTICFSVACVNIAMIGQPGLSLVALFTVVFLAGLGVLGGQTAVNSLAAMYYPTDLRSTGIGSGLGIGRIGAIVGPLMAGELMRRHWSSQDLFYAAAVPALTSAVVIFCMRWVIDPKTTSTSATPEVVVH